MAKPLTVKTIKSQSKVEIQPDASGGAPAPSAAMAAIPGYLQNPLAGNVAAPSGSYIAAGICGIIATLLVIGLLAVQSLEWQDYHGGFAPVFLKVTPGTPAP